MKTTLRMAIMLGMLLFIPCLYSSGQVSVTPDNTPPHPSSMLEVKATDRGMLIPRMTRAQRIAINAPAVGLLVYQYYLPTEADILPGFYYYDGNGWNRIGVNSGRYIGEPYAGGIIFWLDETGKHGLICSNIDLSANQTWSNVAEIAIGDSAHSVWNGGGNSLAIVNQQGHTSSAAKLCLDWTNPDTGTGTHDDWYLPSIGEARHLTNNIYQVQKALQTDGNPATTPLSIGIYWTSTEQDASHAWACELGTTTGQPLLKSSNYFVRAVRAF